MSGHFSAAHTVSAKGSYVVSAQDESMNLRERARRARQLAKEFDNPADRERALAYAAELETRAAALKAQTPKKDDQR